LAELENFDKEEAFCTSLRAVLPEGLEVTRGKYLPPYQVGRKKRSLMSLYRGSEYRIEASDKGEESLLDILEQKLAQHRNSWPENVQVLARETDALELRIVQPEKGSANIYKLLSGLGLEESDRANLEITRTRLLAHRYDSGEQETCSYFDLKLT
jgi:hypothetical protein